ncbi:PqiC family protein [Chitinasiproducens palmae]|uniref:ABC-type transport auxiliary lipoprotein component domain-containing protein n=1 Tax=Chitinasiproducens palmae TaxID=1770053 RepID=A0A1H2PSF0_9BURK|nr:PqiC family protein [Chitinasiproducens palmae]SDV49506.1 hypothetical protein SAMN05216551_108142 [Chitinasiproducens palmae]
MKPLHAAAPSAALSAILSAALLAGCASSPDSKFYTLQPDVATPAAPRRAPPLLVEVLPVKVPQQVQRPQMVLADGEGRVKIDEYHRWSASLDDEVGQALSTALSHDLGALDVYRTPTADSAPRYRVSVSVQRFDSAPDKRVAFTAVWSVRRQPGDATLTCQTALERPVANGFTGLVEGHRQAVAELAGEIGSGILALDAVARAREQAVPAAVGPVAVAATAPAIAPATAPASSTAAARSAASGTSVAAPASSAATTLPPLRVPPCPDATR